MKSVAGSSRLVQSISAMTTMTRKYKESAERLKKEKYPLEEAVDLLTQVSTSKFDGTAEVHVLLGTDPKQGDQQVRSMVTLPHGTGKELRIAALVPEDMVAEVKKAGAAQAGEDNFIKDIEKGNLDFDIVVAVPEMMKKLGKVAKILGQRGLMPSPKAGTVTDDPVQAIKELKNGRMEFRTDKQSIVHSTFGKMSFGKEKLLENLKVFLQAIKDVRPSVLKGDYIKSITLAPSMGPGVKVDVGSI